MHESTRRYIGIGQMRMPARKAGRMVADLR